MVADLPELTFDVLTQGHIYARRRYDITADLIDAYSIALPERASNDPETLARFVFSNLPPWALALMAVRDALVTGLGLKTARQLRPVTAQQQRERVGLFRIYTREASEIVLGEDDKHLDFRLSEPRKFGIDEAKVEHGIMRDEFRAVEKFEKLVQNFRECRLVQQLFVADAVHRKRLGMNLTPLRVDVFMESAACGKLVDQFHAADFDHAVLQSFQTGGFRIENDFTH